MLNARAQPVLVLQTPSCKRVHAYRKEQNLIRTQLAGISFRQAAALAAGHHYILSVVRIFSPQAGFAHFPAFSKAAGG